MEFKNNIIDDLKTVVINILNNLVELNENLSKTYMIIGDLKQKCGLVFKIKNYKKWLLLLNSLEDTFFKSKEKILELESSSLKKKIIEINDTKTLIDIVIIKKKILELENNQIIKFNLDKSNKNNTFLKKKI